MKQVPPELLETIVQRLVDGLKPERVVLFGSHAYGTPTEFSDIDLLEIIVATPQEVERTSFLLRAMRERRALYG